MRRGSARRAATTPYLRAVPVRNEGSDAVDVVVGLDDLAARLRQAALDRRPGRLDNGPSGRALTVALDGPDGVRTVTGPRLRRRPRFAFHDVQRAHGRRRRRAPATDGGSVLQELPDDVAVVESQPAPVAVPARRLRWTSPTVPTPPPWDSVGFTRPAPQASSVSSRWPWA